MKVGPVSVDPIKRFLGKTVEELFAGHLDGEVVREGKEQRLVLALKPGAVASIPIGSPPSGFANQGGKLVLTLPTAHSDPDELRPYVTARRERDSVTDLTVDLPADETVKIAIGSFLSISVCRLG